MIADIIAWVILGLGAVSVLVSAWALSGGTWKAAGAIALFCGIVTAVAWAAEHVLSG